LASASACDSSGGEEMTGAPVDDEDAEAEGWAEEEGARAEAATSAADWEVLEGEGGTPEDEGAASEEDEDDDAAVGDAGEVTPRAACCSPSRRRCVATYTRSRMDKVLEDEAPAADSLASLTDGLDAAVVVAALAASASARAAL
jgi:hypothetical protein